MRIHALPVICIVLLQVCLLIGVLIVVEMVGMIHDSPFLIVSLITASCFFGYWVLLRWMLKSFDIPRVIPTWLCAALDSFPGGVILLDKEERIIHANRTFSGDLGESPEKFQGCHISQLPWKFGRSKPSSSEYPWSRSLRDAAPALDMILGIECRESCMRTYLVNSAPILGETGEILGAFVSFEDVTILEEKEKELRKSKEAAESANRAKSEFLTRMSHEIRTPLNSILGLSDILRRRLEESESQHQEYLNTIYSSGRHLLDLISDLLDLAKIESGKMDVDLDRCSPHILISEVISVLNIWARGKKIGLRFKAAGRIPETILTDPGRLRQVLLNIIGNAIKFTERGEVTIEASLADSKVNPKLTIAVSDTGIGIPQAMLAKIFNPFIQGDTSITRRFGGTGLGLTISRNITEALGGTIAVNSIEGKGSTFTITLDPGPLESVPLIELNESDLVKIQEIQMKPVSVRLPPARILLVDDGDSNRKLISLVLKRAGAEVECAVDGQAGFELVTRKDFDLVLLDMQMPIMDGYTAARKMRQHGVDIPIVALTANALKGDESKCRAAGCSGFLTKPIDIDQLLYALVTELGGTRPRLHSKRPLESKESPKEGTIRSSLPIEDPEFLEIVEEFVGRLHEKLDAMDRAWAKKDLEGLARLAHWLKGAGGTAGLHEFTETAKKLENLAKEKRADRIEDVLNTLREMTGRIVFF